MANLACSYRVNVMATGITGDVIYKVKLKCFNSVTNGSGMSTVRFFVWFLEKPRVGKLPF